LTQLPEVHSWQPATLQSAPAAVLHVPPFDFCATQLPLELQ
jgi:hypothetical protein